MRIILLIIVFCLLTFTCSCEPKDPVEELKNRTLSPEELELVNLYLNIGKLTPNLQDIKSKDQTIEELRSSYNEEIIKKVIEESNSDPEKWLAIINRIYERERIEEERE